MFYHPSRDLWNAQASVEQTGRIGFLRRGVHFRVFNSLRLVLAFVLWARQPDGTRGQWTCRAARDAALFLRPQRCDGSPAVIARSPTRKLSCGNLRPYAPLDE